MSTRRQLLGFGMGAAALGAAGMVGLPFGARAQDLEPQSLAPVSLEPRRVAVQNLHTGEALDAVYWENGTYVADAVRALNQVLRDFRTGDVHFMEPGLYDILDAISAKIENRGVYQIISGYRSPKTNAMLRAKSEGVASHSLHMEGKAMDVRLGGVALRDLRKAALTLGKGGVGYYPTSNFVHVDVGRVRTWQGV